MSKYLLVLGITTKCNGKCKICARHTPACNEGVDLNCDLDLDLVKPHLSNFHTLVFIGGYGEAVLHSKFLDFLDYININYPDMYMLTSSNMSVRSESYWKELATKNIKLLACIDNITSEKCFYRGVDYDICLRNLKAFIGAGGNATWTTLAFDYNKSQINEMENISKDIGCTDFVLKRSFLYLKDSQLDLTGEKSRTEFTKDYPCTDIQCRWKEDKHIYLNEFGIFAPCCHSDVNYGHVRNDEKFSNFYKTNDLHIKNNFEDIISRLELIYKNKDNIQLCKNMCSVPVKFKKENILTHKTISFKNNI
jgi:MoaA/NifB/PqqE/SkfB family radical SAM enzyme